MLSIDEFWISFLFNSSSIEMHSYWTGVLDKSLNFTDIVLIGYSKKLSLVVWTLGRVSLITKSSSPVQLSMPLNLFRFCVTFSVALLPFRSKGFNSSGILDVIIIYVSLLDLTMISLGVNSICRYLWFLFWSFIDLSMSPLTILKLSFIYLFILFCDNKFWCYDFELMIKLS